MSQPLPIPALPLVTVVEAIGAVAVPVLHVGIDVSGRLAAARLSRAVEAVACTVPELAGRAEIGRWSPRWVLDEVPAWPVEEHDDVSAAQADALERALFGRPFQSLGSRPLDVVLVHGPEHDRVLLRVNHLLADGGGTKELAYRIAQAYRRVGDEPGWRPEPTTRRSPLRRLVGLLRPWHAASYLAGFVDQVWAVIAPGAGLRAGMQPVEAGVARAGRLRVDAARVEQLKARWRDQGVTLNDLLLAAFGRALDRCFGDAAGQRPCVNLVVTSDLRQFVDDPDEVENFSTIHVVRLGRRPMPDPEGTVARVRAATARWKRTWLGLPFAVVAVAMVSWMPSGWLLRMARHAVVGWPLAETTRVVMTNIGRIDALRLDFGHGPATAAWVLPPPGRPPVLAAAATGCAGAVDFSVAWYEPAMAAQAVDALLAVMDEAVEALQ